MVFCVQITELVEQKCGIVNEKKSRFSVDKICKDILRQEKK